MTVKATRSISYTISGLEAEHLRVLDLALSYVADHAEVLADRDDLKTAREQLHDVVLDAYRWPPAT